ncbi:MAG: AraC family transcriptional regulator ligand-binding domain-containing protein [Rhodococcus sp. (in: high G+C Gram-positive bacteria)]|uniref:AraC family transcriptional regulator ligand-binding domain-containing protein n=1 Tax=Rhodococcus sp. TaxID=1831 RepID=UPI002AD890D5|nr:AraC family transcriptional regulator ligand-binding domain-containing protein [Rhodococcus sp. (in: high G+C Gram-positive bacteria)]
MNEHPYQIRHPVVSTRHLCATAAELGIPTDAVLVGTALTAEDLHDPDHEVSAWDEITTVRNVLACAPAATGLGVATGFRHHITNLGLLGFAVMACPTLRDMIALTLRFLALTTLHVQIHQQQRADTFTLTLDATHLPPDVREFFVERDLAGIAATVLPFLEPVIDKYADRIRLEIGLDEHHLDWVAPMIPVRDITFQRSASVFEIPLEMLDEPLPQADEHTLRLCRAQCEDLVQRRAARLGVAARVRTRLLAHPAYFPDLDTVAATLHLHPRTLRRRLADEGTNWRALNTEVRATLAAELLTQVGLTVEEVAMRLGYSETAAFTHAFSRWYGTTPSSFRAAARTDRPAPLAALPGHSGGCPPKPPREHNT